MFGSIAETVRALFHQKGISEELTLQAIEESLLAAYKKTFGEENAVTRVNKETFEVSLYAEKEVVEVVTDDIFEITLDTAKKHKADCAIHEKILIQINPADMGHRAAQTARQLITQRLKEIEQNIIYSEYIQKVGQLVTGYYRRSKNKHIFLDLGRTEAILPAKEQSEREVFTPGERIKAVIIDVRNLRNTADIVLSRAHPLFVQRLLEHDIPELEDGIIEIKNIVRHAGYRTKIAVYSDSIDPVGACIGMKGMRIHNIIKELEGEKIDIVRYKDDIQDYIRNALTPARIDSLIVTSREDQRVTAVVQEDQLSLAIGKQGYNVKLATQLTGWHIDIKTADQLTEEDYAHEPRKLAEELFSDYQENLHPILELENFDQNLRNLLHTNSIETLEDLIEKSSEDLIRIPGITEEQVNTILSWIQDNVVVIDKEDPLTTSTEDEPSEQSTEKDHEEYIYSCPECEAEVQHNTTQCPSCGIELEFE